MIITIIIINTSTWLWGSLVMPAFVRTQKSAFIIWMVQESKMEALLKEVSCKLS